MKAKVEKRRDIFLTSRLDSVNLIFRTSARILLSNEFLIHIINYLLQCSQRIVRRPVKLKISVLSASFFLEKTKN